MFLSKKRKVRCRQRTSLTQLRQVEPLLPKTERSATNGLCAERKTSVCGFVAKDESSYGIRDTVSSESDASDTTQIFQMATYHPLTANPQVLAAQHALALNDEKPKQLYRAVWKHQGKRTGCSKAAKV